MDPTLTLMLGSCFSSLVWVLCIIILLTVWCKYSNCWNFKVGIGCSIMMIKKCKYDLHGSGVVSNADELYICINHLANPQAPKTFSYIYVENLILKLVGLKFGFHVCCHSMSFLITIAGLILVVKGLMVWQIFFHQRKGITLICNHKLLLFIIHAGMR